MNNPKPFPDNLADIFRDDDTALRWICYDNSYLQKAVYAPLTKPAPNFVKWVIDKIKEDPVCGDQIEVWLGKYLIKMAEKKIAEDKEKAARAEQFSDRFKELVKENNISNNKLGEVLEGGHATARRWQNGNLRPEPTRPQLVALQKVGLEVAAVNELLAILGQPPLTDGEMWFSDTEVTTPPLQAKVFNAPPTRSRKFVGRDTQLAALREGFMGQQPTQVISGLGGIGKTELALQYAHRYGEEYQVVWWVHADEANQLQTEFNRLTTPLGLPGEKIDDPELVKGMVMRWLAEHEHWLLIFDNADQANVLLPYLTKWDNKARGHILITSRAHDFGRFAQITELGLFSEAEAVAFLRLTTRETDETALATLAQTLGYLPLALEQAAAYLRATGETAGAYVTMFQSFQQELLAKAPTMYDNRTIAIVWNISLDRLAHTNPQTIALLRLCAFLAPDDIPLMLLLEGAKILPPELGQAMANRLDLNDLLDPIYNYSLIERRGESLSIHRLVQAVIRGQMSDEERLVWLENTARLLAKVFKFEYGDDVGNKDSLSKVKYTFPHVLNLINYANTKNWINGLLANLLRKAGLYLTFNGDDQQALTMLQKSLAMFGTESVETAKVHQMLGRLFQKQGNFTLAEQQVQQSLTLYEATVGKIHSETADCLNLLGQVYFDQGQFKLAQAYYEKALIIQQQLYPDHDHADMGDSLDNLGRAYYAQGHFTEAKDYYTQALKICEAMLGRQHLSTATTLNNLALVYLDQKQWSSAQSHLEEALAIKTAILGEQHPELFLILMNLGSVHKMKREFTQAQTYYERVLALGKQILGRDHPDTATFLANLGDLLMLQGKRQEARPYLEQALRIFEEKLGKHHEKTQMVDMLLNMKRKFIFKRGK